MPLITENTRKNARKCKGCKVMKIRSVEEANAFKEMGKALDLSDESFHAMEATMKASCSVCPNVEDFKKVYGVMPHEYFGKEHQ